MGLISSLPSADLQSTAIYIACLPAGIILFTLIQRIYTSFFGPLRGVKGPWLARYTRLWEMFALYQGDFEKQNIALHKRHGKIVRIAPNKYTIDDPDAVRTIYGHGTKFTKTRFYEAFRMPDRSNLFAELDVKEHAMQRRRIASLYSLTNLLSYESFIDKCTAVLDDKFTKFAHEGRAVEMVEFLQFYAFDVIGAITAGNPFGLMTSERDSAGIITAIHHAMQYGGFTGLIPEAHPWIVRAAALFSRSGVSNNAVGAYIQAQISLRRAGVTPADKHDFLTKLLQLEAAGANTAFDTFNGCGSNIAAGSDTTAITLSAVLYHLLRAPRALAALRREIDAAAADGRVADPVTYAQAQDQLPYLQAVLKEALRVHPAVGQPLLRRVPPGGAVVAGRWFPEGAEVGVNPWVAHSNEEVFGADAAAFRPERWLEKGEGEEAKRMEGYFLAFGHGSRTCIGKHISLLEISKVIPQLVRKFDFELVEPEKEWETATAWFTKQKFHCYIKRRAE
ncbi:Cytochrome P450 [Neofusicoccum parvum]|uniref:Cytochrome P450 n=1 Tax=Neofusicoccum parvum TaxID=310453 RepID=A0ACB5S8Y0_9PEZI|nr:Cytochrome P450 [Neofusicoccum parvum]